MGAACNQIVRPDRDLDQAKVCLAMYSIAFFVDRRFFTIVGAATIAPQCDVEHLLLLI